MFVRLEGKRRQNKGVEIDPSCDKNNISIFESSVSLYSSILDYIQDNEIPGGNELACLNSEYNGTYESKEYFKDHFVDKFKEILMGYYIAENYDGDFISVSDIRVPFIAGKQSKELYEYAIKTDSAILPKDYTGWARSLKFFEDLHYSYRDLADSISLKNNLDNLDHSRKKSEFWLKDCISFLLKYDDGICRDYELLPNQLGQFKYERSLKLDKKLPAALKRINEQTEDNYNLLAEKLLNKNFNTLVNCDEYTIKDLAQRIDDNIKVIYSNNDGQIPEKFESSVSALYEWVKNCSFDEEKLLKYFPWFFPKRASLIADMMSEEERNQSLKIVRSGKMEGLSALAETDLTDEELSYLAHNPTQLRAVISHLNNVVDDEAFANKDEGDYGESLVWEELNKLYPAKKGFEVVWSSRDMNESRFDFEILKYGKTHCYCDAKTTARGLANSDSIPLFLRKSQWNFLSTIRKETPYYIARVFLGEKDKIRFIRLTLKD